MNAADTKARFLAALRAMLVRLSRCPDVPRRAIICTPCGGCYGKVAYWLVAVDGSPPRGTLLIGQNRYACRDDVFFIDQDSSRRLGVKDAATVRAFERAYLSDSDFAPQLVDARFVSIPGEFIPLPAKPPPSIPDTPTDALNS